MSTDWSNLKAPAITDSPLTPEAQARAAFLAMSESERIKYRDEKLLLWQKQQQTLAEAKEAELKTRNAIVAILFDPDKDEGTETIELGNGWRIKAGKKLTYTLGNKREDPLLLEVNAAIDTIESLPIDGAKLLADQLVKWSPELSLSTYRLVSADPKFADIRKIIDRVLTTKPGTPTLEIIPPADKNKPKGKR